MAKVFDGLQVAGLPEEVGRFMKCLFENFKLGKVRIGGEFLLNEFELSTYTGNNRNIYLTMKDHMKRVRQIQMSL